MCSSMHSNNGDYSKKLIFHQLSNPFFRNNSLTLPLQKIKSIIIKSSDSSLISCLTSLSKVTIHVCHKQNNNFHFLYLFRSLALTILMITLVQSFKFPNSKNKSNTLDISSYITNKTTSKFYMNISQWNQYYLKNYIILNYHTQFSEL